MKLLLVGVLIAGAGLVAGSVAENFTEDDETVGVRMAASVRDCPSGSVLTSYASGSRVYAVARTESSDWVQVRDLSSPDRTVWVSATDVDLDSDIDGLPVRDCPHFDGTVTALGDTTTTTSSVPDTTTSSVPDTTTSSVPDTTTSSTTTQPSTGTTEPPTTEPPTTEPPTTEPPTTEPPDTTPPTIKQPSALPNVIWENDTESLSCPPANPRESTVSAIVTDDVGVTSVTASWTISGTPMTATMSLSGSTYSTTFGPFDSPTVTAEDPFLEVVTITITARDAAGNTSSVTRDVTVNSVWACFG